MTIRMVLLNTALEELVYKAVDPVERIRHDRRVRRILVDVVNERIRQEDIGEAKRERGIDWRSCADPDMTGGDDKRYVVLGEEVGEVAEALLEVGYAATANLREAFERELRAELVQVAAVAVAWIEAIDTRGAAE